MMGVISEIQNPEPSWVTVKPKSIFGKKKYYLRVHIERRFL